MQAEGGVHDAAPDAQSIGRAVKVSLPLSRPADRQQDAVPAAFHVEERRGTVAGTSRFAVGMVAVACPEPVRDQTVVGVRDVRSLRYPKTKHIRLPGALPVATGARRVGVKRNRNVAVIEIGDATAVMVGRIVPAVYPAHDSVVILALDVAGQFQSVRERVDGVVPLLPYRAVQLREGDAVIVEGKAGLHCIYLLYFCPVRAEWSRHGQIH